MDRRKEYSDKLQQVKDTCGHFLITQRAMTIIQNSKYRSLGVTTLLTNYFKLTAADKQRIAHSNDRGASADIMAYKMPVDSGTMIDGHCQPIDTVKFKDSHDSFVQMDSLFLKHQLLPLFEGEFNVGHNTIVIKESPESTNLVHPVGAIDELKYNERTGKLAVIELKTSKSSKHFSTMEAAFLKEKHLKQVTFYPWLLKNMFDACRIPFDCKDFELYIVGVHETMMQISIWRIQYLPKYFLGGNWSSDKWHSIWAATHRIEGNKLPCCNCQGTSHYQDAVNPRYFWCSKACKVDFMNKNPMTLKNTV